MSYLYRKIGKESLERLIKNNRDAYVILDINTKDIDEYLSSTEIYLKQLMYNGMLGKIRVIDNGNNRYDILVNINRDWIRNRLDNNSLDVYRKVLLKTLIELNNHVGKTIMLREYKI